MSVGKAVLGFLILTAFQCVGQTAPTRYQRQVPSAEDSAKFAEFAKVPSYKGSLQFLRSLSEAEKARWVHYFRNYDRALPYNDVENRSDWPTLMAVNDVETARWLVQQCHAARNPFVVASMSSEIFIHWHHPEGIEIVASAAMTIEDYEIVNPGSDMPWPRASFVAATFLLRDMIPEVAFFPAAVRDWAKGLSLDSLAASTEIAKHCQGRISSERNALLYKAYREREIAQMWWRSNREAIMQERWSEVKPGEGYFGPGLNAWINHLLTGDPKRDALAARATIDANLAKLDKGEVAAPIAPMPPSTVKPEVSKAGHHGAPQGEGNGWYYAAGFSMVVLVVFTVYARRKKVQLK